MNYLIKLRSKTKTFKVSKIFKTAAIALGFVFTQTTVSQNVSFKERSTITNQGLYFWYPKTRDSVAVKAYHYNPSISPRGDCFTIVNGYIFFGWYKGGMKNRDLMISRKKIGSGTWTSVQLPHKNTLIGPKVNGWGDSHNTISVAVSKTDGTIHIFYDHHNDPLKYIVSKPGVAFVKNSDFKIGNFKPTRGYLADGENITITYPQLTENADGDIILNYRKGSAVGGNEMVHVYNGKTSTWSRSKMVLRGSGKPHVEVVDRNYAYGAAPVLAGGNLYYGFSVRWARKKPDDILNEGIYLANCGPTMTSNFVGVNVEAAAAGVNYRLPVQDYSPFLIDLPETKNGKGSSSGPSIAVSNKGDVHLSYRSRGKNATQYYYTYVRKAGEKEFTRHVGESKTGIAFGDRIYHTAIQKSSGKITIQSTKAGTFNYRNDLVYETGEVLGSSVVRLVNGNLVVIVENRSNRHTDSQKVFCFVFNIEGSEIEEPEPEPIEENITGVWYKIKNIETGRYLRAIGGNAIVAASVNSGIDKEWQFIKSGNYYNIDSRTTGDGSGILRAKANDVIGTKRTGPRADVDKVWRVNSLSSPVGSYRIELKDTGRYIYNETNDGNKLIQLSTNTENRSKWTLEATGTSAKTLVDTKNSTVNPEVTIYPNPAKTQVNIKINGMQSASVQILNVLGKTVYSGSITDESLILNSSNSLVSGLYLVKIVSNDGKKFNKKLVIE